MKAYSQMSKEELLALKSDLEKAYDDFKARGLKLDMSRGKPSSEQMDLSMGMMDVFQQSRFNRSGWFRLSKLRKSGWFAGGEGIDGIYDGVPCGRYHCLWKFQFECYV